MEVPAERDTAAASSRREDAGLRVLGRLLWVALVAGALIGGLTAQMLLGWTGPYADGAFAVGALVGMPLALAVQSLNAVVLYGTRRRRPDIGPAGTRVLLLPLPTLAAFACAAGSGSPDASTSAVLVHVVATVLTAVTAWVAAPWCLAPVLRGPGHGRD